MIKKMDPITTNHNKWGFADSATPEKCIGENHLPTMHDIFSSWISTIAVNQNRLYYRDQTAESLQMLFDVVQKYHPSRIIELGTLNGISLRTWLVADDNLKVTAVDLSFKPLRESAKLIPLNLERVQLVETDILKLQNFRKLFDLSEKILFYIDVHDLPGIPIMDHLINTAFPQLPDGSIIAIDDIWYSAETLTNRGMAESFFDRCVADQIDSLQYCEFYYAPYWEGGSFMGFPEIIPFLNWINKFRVKLEFVPGVKFASLLYNSEKPMDKVHFAANFFGQIQRIPFSFSKTVSTSLSDKQRKAVTLINNAIKMFTISYPVNHVLRNFVEAHAVYPELAGIRYAIAVCLAQLGKHDNAEVMLRDEIQSQGQDRVKAASLLKAIESFRHRSMSNKVSDTKLTLFAIPKAFKGHNAIIQRNAITSWTKLTPEPNIILLGKDEGTYEIAKELRLTHIPEVVCNEFGTPLVNSVFELAEKHSKTPWLAYLNADCLLLDDFSKAMEVLDSELSNHQINTFFLSSQRIELDLREPINFECDNWQKDLKYLVKNKGVPDYKAAIEMFFYSRCLYGNIPPFAIGRTVWDNWLVWAAEAYGATMIDATTTFSIIHQCHDWSHIEGGWQQAWQGEEAKRNVALAQGHTKAINHVTTHTLFPRGLERHSTPDDTRNTPLVTTRVNRGVYALKAGNYGAALDFFSDALMRGGGIVENIHYYRALCYAKLGKNQELIESVQKELSIRPNNREAQELFNKIQNTLLTDKRKLKGPFDNIPAPPAHGLSLLDSELNHVIPPEIKEDELYYLIQELARTERVSTVLEIGSSAGEGSTEAFVNGLSENPHGAPRLFCMEVSKSRYAELARRYADKPFVHCYNTSSVPLKEFPTSEEVAEFYHTTKTALNDYPLEQVLKWLTQDIDYVWRSGADEDGIERIKRENAIDCFDIVLIDGSEFTGKYELDKVYGARIILLDDINGYKNYYNYKRLINDHSYSLIAEDGKLRNGYAIFKRSDEVLPIHFFTIVLNGEPFIRYHIDVLQQLPFRWHWHLVEGVADLKHDTGWSLQFGGCITDELHRNGLSNDGTTEYLAELAREFPENITIYRKPKGVFWDGKLEMVNAPIKNINEECLLWQVDADELWTRDQLIVARQMFMENQAKVAAYYYCHYFVGEKLVTTTRNTYGNNTGYEWLRTWRFQPGMRWTAHEPPCLCRELPNGEWEDIGKKARFTHSETESRKLVYQHYAYAMEKQAKFKEIYFGYKDAVKQWKALQQAQQYRILLRDYFAWVNDDAQVGSANSLGLMPLAQKNEQGEWFFIDSKNDRENGISHPYPPDFDPCVVSASSVKCHTKTTVRTSERLMKNILVVSHERSGTHFLINTIGKNFPPYSNSELSVIGTPHELRQIFETYYSIEEVRIFKSHHQFQFFGPFWQDLIKHFHVFYVVRDGRDVLNSCFHYYNKHPNIFPFAQSNNISNLLRTAPDCEYSLKMSANVVERWTNHVESWMDVKEQITIIKYEDLCLNFTDTVKQISKALEIDINGQVVRPSLQKDKSIDPRKGVVGDWRRSFSDKDLRFFNELASGCMQRLDYYKEQFADSNIPANVIWIRTDSIGDNILAASMLPYIRGKYKDAKIAVVCQKHIAEIYEACPFVDDVVTFDRHRAYKDEEYRSSITQQLQAINADIALNSVYSREPLTDVFAIGSGAKEQIAFHGNLCNIPAEMRSKHKQFYSRLLASDEEHKPELDRHRDFLKGLGIGTPSLQPVFWITPEDERFANEFFAENNLQRETTVALFAGVQYNIRFYERYGEALLETCKGGEFTVIAVGTDREHSINQKNLDVLNVPTINLCGKTTLRQTAALLKLCRLAFGAETGTAHMACAVGTPNVVLLGGGHFGRFMPYSPLTSVVCLPLECYGCNWRCRYGRAHCVRDIRPEVITAAIRETLEKTSEIPRAFVQTKFLWNPPVGAPKWKSFEKYLDPKDVEIVCIGEDGPVSEADAVYRQPGTEDGSQMSEALTRRTEVREKKIELQDERSLGSHERLYQTAQEFLGGGRKKEAVDVLEQLVASYPDHAFAHNDLGFLYFNEGDKEKTLQHYKMAAALEPQNYVFQKSLADFYYVVLGQVEDALEYYAKALSRNPEDLETLLMLGHISISLRKFDEASSFYDEVLKIEPLNSDAKEKLDALRRIELRDLREQRALG